MLSALCSMRSGSDSILFYFVSQDPLTDAKAPRSPGLDALMLVEGIDDQISFNFLKGFRKVFCFPPGFPGGFRLFLLEMEGKILSSDDLSAAKDNCPLDDVLQFSHIPGVSVTKEKGPSFFRDVGDRFLVHF